MICLQAEVFGGHCDHEPRMPGNQPARLQVPGKIAFGRKGATHVVPPDGLAGCRRPGHVSGRRQNSSMRPP